jgi:hypothetical protein
MMKKLLLILLCLPMIGFGQNLILNPGFETAMTGPPIGDPLPQYPNMLDHWTAVNVDGEFIFNSILANSGNGFLSVLQNANANSLIPWLGQAWNSNGFDRVGQIVNIIPLKDYKLEFWCRYGDGSRYGYGSGDLVVQIEGVSPITTIISQVVTPSNNWEKFDIIFSTGNNMTELMLLFSSMGPNNTDIWIDDVNLQSLEITSMNNFSNIKNRKIIKRLDMDGKQINSKINTPFIEIYDDGTVEKIIVIE